MQEYLHQIVIKKTQRLRICTLLVLLAAAAGLMLTPPSPAPTAPAEAHGALQRAGGTVALDPGHGGYDGGARAQDSGLWEKDITLRVTLKIEEALQAHGASTVLTRREDVCLADGNTATKARKRQDLQRRVDIAEAAGADVLLSIHMNEYRSRAVSGPQVFYQRSGDAGRLLAGALQEALLSHLDPPKRRVAMAGDYYVLRGKLPSALVECGFISNEAEERLLLDEGYQEKIGHAIADGLAQYRELLRRMQEGGDAV